MCLYIITQQAGAALHRILDEGQRGERVFIITFHVNLRTSPCSHSAHSFKKHSHLLPLFSKANS